MCLPVLLAHCTISQAFTVPRGWIHHAAGLGQVNIEHIYVFEKAEGDVDVWGVASNRVMHLAHHQAVRSSFKIPGESGQAHQILVSPERPSTIFVAADDGLYVSHDNGGAWENIFIESRRSGRKCLSVLDRPEGLYVGTTAGVYFRRAYHRGWSRIWPNITDPIRRLSQARNIIYVATSMALYQTYDGLEEVGLIFTSGIVGEEGSDTDKVNFYLRDFDVRGDGTLIIASSDGLYTSAKGLQRWDRIKAGTFPFRDINRIQWLSMKKGALQHERIDLGQFIVATNRGAFLYQNGQWISLYQGMFSNQVNDMVVTRSGEVFAATDSGIYSLNSEEMSALLRQANNSNSEIDPADHMEHIWKHELDINQVHHYAIQYADVHPDKITAWKNAARRQGWFPKLDIGVDGGRGWSRSDSLWGSSSSGGTHYIGPDDKSRSQDVGWDVQLSWDLADIVWNSDQTSIDSRSKLLTELRDDILNQATRIFYERRRLQIQKIQQGDSVDVQLRIEELTALLDALTGGEFSRAKRIGKTR